MNDIKLIVTMFCGSNTYDLIKSDKEIVVVNGVPLDNPVKFVYDDIHGIYFNIYKNNGWMDDRSSDKDIIITNISQFGEEPIKENDLFAAIAKLTDGEGKSNNIVETEELPPLNS